jgi:hypothetical protein
MKMSLRAMNSESSPSTRFAGGKWPGILRNAGKEPVSEVISKQVASEERTNVLTPPRCVHIGDCESDAYELFCTARELGTRFLVRTCVDRLVRDGEHTIADEMDEKCRSTDCTVSKSEIKEDMCLGRFWRFSIDGFACFLRLASKSSIPS